MGSHLVDALLAQGAQVKVTVHQRGLHRQHERLTALPADLMQMHDCLRVTEDIDYLFHAAGPVAGVGLPKSAIMEYMRINLMMAFQVLQAAWTNKVSRFLLFSSSTGYPAYEHPVREADFWQGDLHPSYLGYGWMRRYLEKLAEFVISQSDLQIAILRPGAVYGPRDNFDPLSAHVIPALIIKATERISPFEVWGTGQEVRDFLHVSDLVRGALLLLEHQATGEPVNIAYGQGVTIQETVELILEAADYTSAELLFNHDKPVNIPIRLMDIGKAQAALGFVPEISLAAGLNETVRWYLTTPVQTNMKP